MLPNKPRRRASESDKECARHARSAPGADSPRPSCGLLRANVQSGGLWSGPLLWSASPFSGGAARDCLPLPAPAGGIASRRPWPVTPRSQERLLARGAGSRRALFWSPTTCWWAAVHMCRVAGAGALRCTFDFRRTLTRAAPSPNGAPLFSPGGVAPALAPCERHPFRYGQWKARAAPLGGRAL